jgi:4-amino-4-deoxy-L-arabinose transferase-like glycosyltransferase
VNVKRAAVARAGSVAGRALAAAVLLGVAATIVVGLEIQADHPHERLLGTALPPFLMSWSPHVRWPALVGIAVAGLLIAGAPWAVSRLRSGAGFAALVYLASIALGLAVNAARRGPSGWSHVFVLNGTGSFEASREYLPALPELRGGVAHYVRDFPQLVHGLPTHTKGNPPGPVIAMHLLDITTAGRLAAACIVVGALCAPLAYALGRELGDDRRGRIAALLTAFSPSVVLFGVTSVDYAFAGLGTAVAVLMLARPRAVVICGCVLAGIASFFSYVLLAIPVWAVLCAARRDGVRRAVRLALGALAAGLAVTLVLNVVWDYDPIAMLHSVRGIYARGAAAHRPYAFWVFGSPAAFLAMLGAPIAWLASRAAGRGEPAALALVAVIVVAALGGFTKAETERIWLPFVPLACVAAASLGVRRLRLMLVVLAVQAIAVEVLFGTVW